nr:MAG TPA: hypothetical protein [Caudoviricetes sp.]
MFFRLSPIRRPAGLGWARMVRTLMTSMRR